MHIVSAMLKYIGKYIEESGLDRLFVEAGLYGESTLPQILNGKHMRRAREAHLTMYLALYCAHLRASKLKGHKLPTETIKSEINLFIDAETKGDFKHYQNNLVSFLAECSQLLSKFDDSLTYQNRFLRNYMNMVKVLLLFTRASRQGLWELHLYSLNEMENYFVAHNQIKYARLSTVFLAMSHLQESDPGAWCYLKENFEIAKSVIPFTAIGLDQAMEKENKVMKVNIFSFLGNLSEIFEGAN